MVQLIKNTKTFRLFARPSFVEGMARVLDLGSTLNTYNYSKSAESADRIAIADDWMMVGVDMREALKEYARAGRQKSHS
jgi:hypothetical protein